MELLFGNCNGFICARSLVLSIMLKGCFVEFLKALDLSHSCCETSAKDVVNKMFREIFEQHFCSSAQMGCCSEYKKQNPAKKSEIKIE